ncbi:MAG: hypothetical protein U5K51_10825 [Flavobacteriaceae bacterium]|nr:hypothetical protein [Flavobacteriaceae bacterium]
MNKKIFTGIFLLLLTFIAFGGSRKQTKHADEQNILYLELV